MCAATAFPYSKPTVLLRVPARANRPLLVFGGVMLTLVPLFVVALLIDARTLDGGHVGVEAVWLKPLKFHLATGVHLITVGLCAAALSEERRRDRTMHVLVALLIGCSVFEIGYIALRGGLGLRSHFATDPLGQGLYYLMGVASVVIVVVTAVLGFRILRERPAGVAPHLHLAAGLALIISGVAGLVSGISISVAGGPLIGPAAGGGAVPLFGWSLVAGDLRVAHFFGLHAAQALPLLALIVGPRGTRHGVTFVRFAAACGSAVIAAVWLQALAGQPFLSF